MASVDLTPALRRIVDNEARLLRAEFGAGAVLFADGQLTDARRSGKPAAILFWTAIFEAMALRPPAEPPIKPAAGAASSAVLALRLRRRSGSRPYSIGPAPRGGWQASAR